MGVLHAQFIERHPTDALKLRLTWSEPANAADAGTFGNYAIDNGVTVSAAAVVAGSGNLQVDLTVSAIVLTTTYTLTISNVRDVATSTAIISPNNQQKYVFGTADERLNGVPHQGGLLERGVREHIGDKALGYNVITEIVHRPRISNFNGGTN